MRRTFEILLYVAALGTGTVQATAPPAGGGALQRYVAAPDASYHWREVCTARYAGGDYRELLLRSQRWRGRLWRHQLFIVRPADAPARPRTAALLVSGGDWHESYRSPGSSCVASGDAQTYEALAAALGMPLAILRQVPEQPLFGGRREDALIAYSFQQYLKTRDPRWPLLLPMVKSVVRAMDAVQSYARERWRAEIGGFLLFGASKRGWTTWLTAAVDPRVKAFAPISFTMLDIPAELAHQRRVWGGLSPEIHDYTALGLTDKMQSGEAADLLRIVDPVRYAAALTQPKLLVIGTDDPYWPVDAANLYWPALPRDKYLLYLPNNGHSPSDFRRLFGDLAALARRMAEAIPLPQLHWRVKRQGQRYALEVFSRPRPARLRVWRAYAAHRGFRGALWRKIPVGCAGSACRWQGRAARAFWTAFFGEAEYRAPDGRPYFLSTTVTILPPAGYSP